MATKKKKPAKPGKATDPMTPAMAACEQLLLGFKEELTTLKNPGNKKQNIWGTLSEIQQDELLDRFSRRIRHHFSMAFDAILANDLPAVHATLAGINLTDKGVRATLEISGASAHLHEFVDFRGKEILAILTPDNAEYLDSMSNIKPDKDQAELGLETKVDDPDDDPRPTSELVNAANSLALKLEENDVPDETESWDRSHLLDYITWAESKLAEPEPTSKPH